MNDETHRLNPILERFFARGVVCLICLERKKKDLKFHSGNNNLYKSIKYDGYYINVIYKDDPTYRYKYYWWINLRNERYNISLYVHDIETDAIIHTTDTKKMPKYNRLN